MGQTVELEGPFVALEECCLTDSSSDHGNKRDDQMHAMVLVLVMRLVRLSNTSNPRVSHSSGH